MVFSKLCSGDQIKKNEMGGACLRMGKGTYRVLMWKSDGRRLLGRPRRGCEVKRQSSPVTGLEWPRGFQEFKVPRFHYSGTGWW